MKLKRRKSSFGVLLLVNLLLIMTYFVTGYFNLKLDIPVGFPSAVWVPAGLALGFVLVWGPGCLPGVFLGCFAMNVYVSMENGVNMADSLTYVVVGALALGATIQAAVGWGLANRFIGLTSPLEKPKNILGFALLTGPLSCVVNASWSLAILYHLGMGGHNNVLFNWSTWWVGDTIGVLIFAPICLTLFGQPHRIWRRRFLPVTMPLLIVLAVVLFVFWFSHQSEQNRVRYRVSQQMFHALTRLGDKLKSAREVTRSLAAYIHVTPDITKDGFSRFSKVLLQTHDYLQALEWIPQIRDRDAFEIKHNVLIREVKDGKLVKAENRELYFPVLYVEPLASNEPVVGYDLGSNAGRLEALLKALRQNKTVMSEPITLIQTKTKQIGALLFRPVYRDSRFKGYALTVINVSRMIRDIFGDMKRFEYFRVIDKTSPSQQEVVYGYDSKITPNNFFLSPLALNYSLNFAGRQWRISVAYTSRYLRHENSLQVWFVLFAGVAFSLLLHVLLFILDGQKRSIERIVEERTEELHEAEAKSSLLLASVGEGVFGVNTEGQVTFINPTALELLGYDEDEILGRDMHQLIHHTYPDGKRYEAVDCPIYNTFRENKEHQVRNEVFWKKNGEKFWVEYSSAPLVREDKVIGAVIVFTDMTEQYESEQRLEKMAHSDSLTGLPNRVSFMENLALAIARTDRSNSSMAVCFMDLDDFKKVNDEYGHAVGDMVLKRVPEIFKLGLRSADYLARYGGDEFVLILESVGKPDEIRQVIKRYLELISRPIQVDNIELHIGLSVGIALYPADGKTPEELLINADKAMYRAKEKGKNTFAFFDYDL